MENVSRHKELFEKFFSFLEKEGATKIAVFGSYARGEEKNGEIHRYLCRIFPDKKSTYRGQN